MALATVSDGDFRNSGAMSLFSLTPAFIVVLLALKKPWSGGNKKRRSLRLAGFGLVGLFFLVTALGGTPEYLEEQFGWFIGLDDFGPRAVVSSPNGYAVVGDDADHNAVIWLSSNGEDWNRVAHSQVLEQLEVGDVISIPSGLVLAAHDDYRGPVQLLTSENGTDWIRAGSDETGGIPTGLAVNRGIYSIVGESFSNDSIFLYGTSADELLLAEPVPHIDTERNPVDVAALGNGFLSAVNQKSDAVFMTSVDGSRWVESGRFPKAKFSSLSAYDTGYVAVGYDRGEKSAAIWVSDSGEQWSRKRLPLDFQDARLDLVTTYESQLLLIGHRTSDETTLLWRFDDWNVLESVISPFGDAVVRDAVMDDSLTIVVGVDRETDAAAFWISDSFGVWRRISHDDSLFTLHWQK